MRKTLLVMLLSVVAGASALTAQTPDGTVEFRREGLKVDVPIFRGHLEVAPVMTLLGGDASFSPSAGVWALSLGDQLVQIAPDRRLVLLNGTLAEANDAPITSPSGVAVSVPFLEDYVLATFGYHLETIPGGYAIRDGASVGKPVVITPAAADFSATTTLVLSPDRPVEAKVEETDGGIVVLLPRSTPRIEHGDRLRSRRIRSLTARPGRLDIELAGGFGVISSNVLTDPDRIVIEIGTVRPTPTPAPVIEPPVRASGPRPIVIDPGHGGDDTGAIGEGGLMEKELTLAIARRLARTLESHGFAVRLTRDSDTSRALTDRAALANRLDALAFVSLHANASTVSSVRGAETYYMSLDDRASDAAAQSTADIENQANGSSGKGHSPLDLILWDMAQSEVLNESAHLALDVQTHLNALLNLKDRGVKQAPFVVLTGATMPAVLVEVGFLSNADERERLASPSHQQELADAIARGIEDFLGR